MTAYDATYTDKRTRQSVTKRAYSRQLAAAIRAAKRSDDGIVTWDYSTGTVTISYIKRSIVFKQV
jgi:hypothetical protein